MDIIYYVGPIQCSLKSKESLSQIFEIFETLSAKKEDDWNKFKVRKKFNFDLLNNFKNLYSTKFKFKFVFKIKTLL